MPNDPEASPSPAVEKKTPWLAVVLGALSLVAGTAAGLWFFWQDRGPTETPPPVVRAEPAPVVDAGPALKLEDGDALLKKLAAQWSTDPIYASWVEAIIIRQLAAATMMMADGQSPKLALPFLRLKGAFEVREVAPPMPKVKRGAKVPPRGPSRYFISPASWARYDELTKAFTSVNAAAAGDAYGQLRPYLEVAFGEIAQPGRKFDDALGRALGRVEGVRWPEGEVEVVPRGLAWAYKDESLEALPGAEKQLLRLGPTNGRAVQATVKTFAEHAGIKVP